MHQKLSLANAIIITNYWPIVQFSESRGKNLAKPHNAHIRPWSRQAILDEPSNYYIHIFFRPGADKGGERLSSRSASTY
jgi:hypothetical protein